MRSFWYPTRIRAVLAIGLISCMRPPIMSAQTSDMTSQPVETEHAYTCAAESLYVIARICEHPLSYKRCIDLLPTSSKGNSLLELKRGMQSAGLQVQAEEIQTEDLQSLKSPAVMLEYGDRDQPLGHFAVLRPFADQRIQILDFPHDPAILRREDLVSLLKNNGNDVIRLLISPAPAGVSSDPQVLPGAIDESAASHTAPSIQLVVTKDLKLTGSSSWNFGNVSEGVTVSKDFVLENRSDRTVRIELLKTGCGCTNLRSTKSILLPDDSAEILMTISMAGRAGSFHTDGLVVFDKADGLPPVLLQALGSVTPRWVCVPESIDVGALRPESPVENFQINVRPATADNKIHIREAKCLSPALSATVTPGDKPGAAVIAVLFDPSKAGGLLDSKVELHVEGQADAAVSIPVKGTVYRPIIIEPQSILIDASSAAEAQVLAQTLTITNRDGTALELLGSSVEGMDRAEIEPPVKNGDAHDTFNLVFRATNVASRFRRGIIHIVVGIRGTTMIQKFAIPIVVYKK